LRGLPTNAMSFIDRLPFQNPVFSWKSNVTFPIKLTFTSEFFIPQDKRRSTSLPVVIGS